MLVCKRRMSNSATSGKFELPSLPGTQALRPLAVCAHRISFVMQSTLKIHQISLSSDSKNWLIWKTKRSQLVCVSPFSNYDHSLTIIAESLLLGSKKKENGEKEHMSRQYRVWIDHLTRTLHECMPLEESYVLLHSSNMVGLFTCVFVKHKERHNIKNLNASEIKRGMGGLHGNKVCDDISSIY